MFIIADDGASASEVFRTFNTRPIDKKLKVVKHGTDLPVDVQVNTVLHTATFPCTVFGLRWQHVMRFGETNFRPMIHWVIVVLPDGQTLGTISTGDGEDLYVPEQDVLAFGLVRSAEATSTESPNAWWFEGSTTTKRKLKQGDQLVFALLPEDGGTAVLVVWDSVVQFFLMA